MFKTNVGYSVNPDALSSGKETATKASEGLSPKVGLLFTSCNQNQSEIVNGVKSVCGEMPFIGCTSSAAIVVSGAGYIGNETGYSGMMTFGGEEMTASVAGSAKDGKEPREIGKALAREAIEKSGTKKVPSYFTMIASPADEEEYLKGIQDVIGRVPMFGGSAADNTVEGKWSIICNDKIFSDGCAIAFFFANNECKTMYTGAFEETTNVGVITKVTGKRTIAEIDHVPALEKYCAWTGKDIASVQGGALLAASVCDPLGVKDVLGDVTAVRHPMSSNPDNTINVGNDLAVGTAIMQLHTTVDGLIHSNSETVTKLNAMMKKEVEGYFLVHCGGRRLAIAAAGCEKEIYDDVVKSTNGKPFLMVFTFGEYGYANHSANTCGGLSLSFTGFSK